MEGEDHRELSKFQMFASNARLIKCKTEPAGEVYGTQGNKIGNASAIRAFTIGTSAPLPELFQREALV